MFRSEIISSLVEVILPSNVHLSGKVMLENYLFSALLWHPQLILFKIHFTLRTSGELI